MQKGQKNRMHFCRLRPPADAAGCRFEPRLTDPMADSGEPRPSPMARTSTLRRVCGRSKPQSSPLNPASWAPRARAAVARDLSGAARAVPETDHWRADGHGCQGGRQWSGGTRCTRDRAFFSCRREQPLALRTRAHAAASPVSSARAASCILIPRFAARTQEDVYGRPPVGTTLLLLFLFSFVGTALVGIAASSAR